MSERDGALVGDEMRWDGWAATAASKGKGREGREDRQGWMRLSCWFAALNECINGHTDSEIEKEPHRVWWRGRFPCLPEAGLRLSRTGTGASQLHFTFVFVAL